MSVFLPCLCHLLLEAGENILRLYSISKRGVRFFPGLSESYWVFPVHFNHGSGLVVFVEDPSHPFDCELKNKQLYTRLLSAVFAMLFLFEFCQEIPVLLNLRSQGFSPSGHSFYNSSRPIRHGAETHVFECPIGGTSSSFSILVVHRVNVGGCEKGMPLSDSCLFLAASGLALFGSSSGFGLSYLEFEHLVLHHFLVCSLRRHKCVAISFLRGWKHSALDCLLPCPYMVMEENCVNFIRRSKRSSGWLRLSGKFFRGQTKAEDSVIEPLVRCVIEYCSWCCEGKIPGDAVV